MNLAFDDDLLKTDFLSAAELRRHISREPDAAALLEKLAATVTDVDPALLEEYGTLIGAAGDGEFTEWEANERSREMLREVGFTRWPQTASEFIQEFIVEMRGPAVDLATLETVGSA